MEFLQAKQKQDPDLFLHRMWIAGQPVMLAGYFSLIDLPQTMMLLQQQARHAADSERPLSALASGLGERIDRADEQAVFTAISDGCLLVVPEAECFEGYLRIVPVSRTLSRSIEAPTTESVLRGSASSFNEDLDTNLGMLKKHMLSDLLRTRSYRMGKDQNRKLTLIYMEKHTDSSLLKAVCRKIEAHLDKEIPDLIALSEDVFEFPKWSLVTRFNTTELPHNASAALGQGKVVLLLDRYPFAIILPSMITDVFSSVNDRNYPLLLANAVRLLRIIGVLANMLMPGLYVALVSVNPDVLRIELAMSIAGSREGVPYPSLVETLLLLFVLELTLEASIRLPKSIGPTITMVGGIILGQAVVQARLVSNVLIIILAATTIASFTAVGFHNAITIRVPKYLLLLLSAIFGVLGLFVGILIVSAYLASVKSFGVPYASRWKNKRSPNG
ncbi:spore germination protein [Cohnella zeiphila]|uniref:Spore germination protein n=1 Tax=Cohnella zeiphila TaxID=2761120 RepID=A0A7X0SUS5_9BACL|nr:spore germination protein [Cohnella zeiphila]MBB6735300.1 spore germination protein [Cohnella zeiphila]